MCGFTGFWQPSAELSQETLLSLGGKMAQEISFRGPDDGGVWADEQQGLALAHRRLSIVDLSKQGHQPMLSQSGKSLISYNGEIYNTDEIRQELIALGKTFRSQTDTEVLLEGCEVWGVSKMVSKCIGMFAFAFWDISSKTLTLVRDRLGIKPLYYGRQGDVFFFGSQLRSFLKHPRWSGEIDRQALVSYFHFNYIPAPESIYKGIKKLRPGYYIEIQKGQIIREEAYWDLHNVVQKSVENRCSLNESDQIDKLETLLQDSVKRRMVADVPLGAFLSGGIDSSLVVALMQSQSTRAVKTYSIGFNERGFDEAQYAQKVARHLNTDHHELYVTSQQAQDVIPDLATFYDEPFADSSQIPMFLVSKLAREQVTVALSGDGGDELFGGYARYFLGNKLWKIIQRSPSLLLKLIEGGITSFSAQTLTKFGNILPKTYFTHLMGDKLYKLRPVLGACNEKDFYARLIKQFPNPYEIVKNHHKKSFESFPNLPLSFVEKMQFADSQQYLPDDILTKVDRASMAISLEARVPLIDHRVFEYAWQLPETVKIRDGKGKWILRQILKRYVPEHLFERSKMGFGVPIGDWIRHDLREWCESLLSVEALEAGGLLNAKPIRDIWEQHLSGHHNWQYPLWGVLMFQMWRSRTLTQ